MLGTIWNSIKNLFMWSPSHPSADFAEWVKWGFGGQDNDSGIRVDGVAAMRYPPVWYGVNKIAGHVGMLPFVLHERVNQREQQAALMHPAYRLMKDDANEWMSAGLFRETITGHALLWGNGRAFIQKDGNGQPSGLFPLDPAITSCVVIHNRDQGTRNKYHIYRDPETHEEVKLPDRDVLHIQGLGTTGFQGYSVIELAQNSLGLGLATEKATNRFFANDATPSLLLEAPPGAFRDEGAAKEFLSKFNEHHSGPDNKGKAGLLREGIKATPLTVSGRDAQWLEQRKFQRQEAALWLLLEQILGDDSSVSYNSLEQKNIAYLVNCLQRWLVKWEQECNKKLLTPTQRRTNSHNFKFNTSALLMMTARERAQYYQIMRQIEVYSANEVREKENMNPRDGGDDYANPAINPKDKNEDGQLDDTFKSAITTADAMKLLAHEDRPSGEFRPNAKQMREMINRRLHAVVCDELQGIRKAASKHFDWVEHKHGNFIEWMDKFYSTFQARVELAIGDADMGAAYVTDSKEVLLEVAGMATNEELNAMVTTATEHWTDRVQTWTDKAMEQYNG